MRCTLLIILGGLFLCAGPLVWITGTLITFIMPESFSSTVRIRLDHPVSASAQGVTNTSASERLVLTEAEVMISEVVLDRVIRQLDLNQEWGKRYTGGFPLRSGESLQILKGRIMVRPVRGANIVDVVAYSEKPSEAADLANGLADAYSEYLKEVSEGGESGVKVQLIQRAAPDLKPAKPNKPLNILLAGGMGLVIMLFGGVLLAVGLRTRK